MRSTTLLLLLLGSVLGNPWTLRIGIRELETPRRELNSERQLLTILQLLPDASREARVLEQLTSTLAVESLGGKQAGAMARCLIRLDHRLTTIPGARQSYHLGPDPMLLLGDKLVRIVAKDRAKYDRDLEMKLESGNPTLPAGEIAVLRELVAWGRENGSEAPVLLAIETELNRTTSQVPSAAPAEPPTIGRFEQAMDKTATQVLLWILWVGVLAAILVLIRRWRGG